MVRSSHFKMVILTTVDAYRETILKIALSNSIVERIRKTSEIFLMKFNDSKASRILITIIAFALKNMV